jgi:hypothetical protein
MKERNARKKTKSTKNSCSFFYIYKNRKKRIKQRYFLSNDNIKFDFCLSVIMYNVDLRESVTQAEQGSFGATDFRHCDQRNANIFDKYH